MLNSSCVYWFVGRACCSQIPYPHPAVFSYHTHMRSEHHHIHILAVFMFLVGYPVAAEELLPPYECILKVSPQARDWLAAPVLVKADQLPDQIDPHSLRLFRKDEYEDKSVPFRLQTEGLPPHLVSLSWIKEGTGIIEYTLRYDTLESGKEYDYPDAIPMTGCGEPLAFGSRSATGWMSASYNTIYAVVDWDGDGDGDLFASNSGPNEASTLRGIYYYENLGPGQPGLLSPPQRILQETGEVSVVDWNGDGTPDLVVGGKVFMNSGTQGEFSFREPETVEGLEEGAHDFADWDRDGLFDALVGRGDGSGYRPARDAWDPAREAPYTSEGIWKGGRTEGKLLLQRNTGTRTLPRFEKAIPLVRKGGDSLGVHGSVFPCVTDWNRDGIPDLLCGGIFRLYLFFGADLFPHPSPEGKGRMILFPGKTPEGIYLRPVTVDWDGDGDLDVILGQESGFAALVENMGDGYLKDPVILTGLAPLLDAGCLSTPSVCDWNGDGVPDLISGNSYGEVLLFESENTGANPPARTTRPFHWGKTTPTLLPIHIQAGPNGSIQGPEEARYGYTNTEVCDWDGDGLPDLLVSDVWGRNRWYQNTGTRESPALGPPRTIRVAWNGPPPKPAWVWWQPEEEELVNVWRTRPESVDWNNDGLMDLVTLDQEGCLAWFERQREENGALVLSPAQRIFVDGKGQPLHFGEGVAGRAGRGTFDLVDWDQDGDHDLLTYEFDTLRSVGYYQNSGSDKAPAFQYLGDLLVPRGIILAGHSTTPAALDFDLDGILDLLVGCEDGLVYAFHRAFIENDLPQVELIDSSRNGEE